MVKDYGEWHEKKKILNEPFTIIKGGTYG